ncbi:MAG: hypothetical protein ACI9V8_001430 [Urechidicola sp.]|jgi:hypothetical protein
MPNIQKPKDKPLPNSEQPTAVPNVINVENEKEYGGPKGKDPTRYGDWEKNGRCIDF